MSAIIEVLRREAWGLDDDLTEKKTLVETMAQAITLDYFPALCDACDTAGYFLLGLLGTKLEQLSVTEHPEKIRISEIVEQCIESFCKNALHEVRSWRGAHFGYIGTVAHALQKIAKQKYLERYFTANFDNLAIT